MNNMNINPKCSICRTYFVPLLKSSGLPFKTCERCRMVQKEFRQNNAEKIQEYNKEYRKNNAEKIQEQKKEYYQNNAGKIQEQNKEYNQNNAEKIQEYNKEYNKEYRQNNAEKIKEGKNEYYQNNADKLKEQSKEYRQNNAEKIQEYNKEYRQNNAEKIKEGKKEYYQTIKQNNIPLYLVNIQRNQINRCFKLSKNNKNKHSIEYLGCNIEILYKMFNKKMEYFNQYLASDVIMTYDNIHIDHIKPVSRFNLDDEDEFLDCCHYSNLQPLLSKDNLKKNNKWSDTNEEYWKANIKDKEYYEIYLVV